MYLSFITTTQNNNMKSISISIVQPSLNNTLKIFHVSCFANDLATLLTWSVLLSKKGWYKVVSWNGTNDISPVAIGTASFVMYFRTSTVFSLFHLYELCRLLYVMCCFLDNKRPLASSVLHVYTSWASFWLNFISFAI